MTKRKILVQMEHCMKGVGIKEIIRMTLGEGLDVCMVHSFEDVEKQLDKGSFDVLIMEFKMAKGQHKLKLEAFLKVYSPIKILMICDVTDLDFCRWLYLKGVLGVTDINDRPAEMGKAIANVYNGDMHVDNSMLMRMIRLNPA